MLLPGAHSAPNFDDPLGLLTACHERILGFCDLLERLPDWIERHGVDDEVRTAAHRILHYFNTAGRLHHQDEENDLFPLLRQQPALRTLIERLEHEHRAFDRLWTTLSIQLEAVSGGSSDTGTLSVALGEFCAAQREHVALENAQILPLAKEVLTDEQCSALGVAMAARRDPGPT